MVPEGEVGAQQADKRHDRLCFRFARRSDARVLAVTRLTDDGVRVLALAALDQSGEPDYDREIGRRLSRAGVHVGAMTPGGLAEFVAGCIR